jgi:hypothetical protein
MTMDQAAAVTALIRSSPEQATPASLVSCS